MRIKSTLAKTAVAGTLAVAALGAGAGIASAQPGADQQQRPAPEQQQQHGPQQQGAQHNDPGPQQPQHGFWLFGQWIPLP
ncbi:hypothetical protein ACLMAJ_21380 [Nocardia sp. KC 131]|uniref:hypothetical protein n=1 Tax=Nocardia arseniciresistens TaxID=3392119 RepID=UPI00398F4F3C